jgi:hypothetical protein
MDQGQRLLEIVELLKKPPSELHTLTEADWMFIDNALNDRARRAKASST